MLKIIRNSVIPLAVLWASFALAQSQITHVIIVVQENRTVDNLFGSNPTFEPNVDIATSGSCYGTNIPLTSVPRAYCYDLGHGHSDFVSMYDGGKMDGACDISVIQGSA